MKKLIALTLSLAIVLCFSFVVMADPTITMTYTGGVDGTFTATVDSAVVGDQATLLAYPTTELGLVTTGGTNIEYIDQLPSTAGTTVFEFKMKNDVVANQAYTIKVGGSLLTTPLSVTNYVPYVVEATGYNISGTVSNATAPASWDQFDGGGAEDTAFNAILDTEWKTTINLYSIADESIINNQVYDGLASATVLKTTVVDPTAKTFELTAVDPGTYIVEINRAGFINRFVKVEVVDSSVVLDDKSLIPGDVAADSSAYDMQIGPADTENMFLMFGNEPWVDYGSPRASWIYNPSYDIANEGNLYGIGPADIEAVFANFGATHWDYNELVEIY